MNHNVITELPYLLSQINPCPMSTKVAGYKDYHIYLCNVIESGFFQDGQLIASKGAGEYNAHAVHQVYYFESRGYYVVIDSYEGSCDGCLDMDWTYDENNFEVDGRNFAIEALKMNVRRATICDTLDEAERVLQMHCEHNDIYLFNYSQ